MRAPAQSTAECVATEAPNSAACVSQSAASRLPRRTSATRTDAASDSHAPRGAARSGRRSPASRAGRRVRGTWASAPALAKQQVATQRAIERLVGRNQQLMRANVGGSLAQRGQVRTELVAIFACEILRCDVECLVSLDVFQQHR